MGVGVGGGFYRRDIQFTRMYGLSRLGYPPRALLEGCSLSLDQQLTLKPPHPVSVQLSWAIVFQAAYIPLQNIYLLITAWPTGTCV